MKKNNAGSKKTAALRKTAEELLQQKGGNFARELSNVDIQSLIHELQVHQIELEMQNDELRNTLMQLEESRAKYSDLYDFAPIGYFNLDRDGLIRETNLTGAGMLQVDRILLINKPFSVFVHKDDRNAFYAYHNSILKTLSRDHCEIRLTKKDGTELYALLECLPVQNPASNAIFRTAVIDITDRKATEKALKETETRYEDLYDNAPDMFVSVDAKTTVILNCNRTLAEAIQYGKEEVIGRDLLEIYHPDCMDEVRYAFKSFLKTGETRNRELVLLRKDGTGIDVNLNCSAVRDKKGNILYSRSILHDITERKKLEKHLQEAVLTDDLTGLYNRRGFYTLAEQQCMLANRTKRRISLLYMDLDNMKKINDELGHKTGDQALIDVARILRSTFRKSDIIARIGGDEFAVLLVEHSTGIKNIIKDHLADNLRIQNKQAGARYKLSLSIGISQYDPDNPCSLEDLLSRADELMYKDKKLNRLEALSREQFKERREHERFIAENIGNAQLDASGKIKIKNISLGGICLNTIGKLIPGEYHFLNIVSSSNEETTAQCEVIWSVPAHPPASNKGADTYEAGLKFSDLNKSKKRSLESILSNI